MTKLEILPERIVCIRFGPYPSRQTVVTKLAQVATAMRARRIYDVLVQAQELEELERELDREFLNWIVLNFDRLRRFAVVTPSASCERVDRLAFITGKEFRLFEAPFEARNWLRTSHRGSRRS